MTVQYKTIEFHRFGSPEGLLKPENRYIRTSGWDTVATEVSPSISHRDFLLSLRALRYLGAASEGDVLAAQTRLSAEAVSFLPVSIPVPGELLQLDLVTNAAELWAFPFEACFARYPDWLATRDDGVVVTRRIRGDFSETTTAWPTTPRVLFAHAPVTADLGQALVDHHVRALTRALDPWGKGKEIGSDLLTVTEIASAGDLSRLHREFKPTFIHLLAHGTVVRGELGLPEDDTWGLRLGKEGARGTPPADIADVLSPIDGLPLVVTVAACDSGHESSVLAKQSVVQELHRKGVPVVIGSQLPLTAARLDGPRLHVLSPPAPGRRRAECPARRPGGPQGRPRGRSRLVEPGRVCAPATRRLRRAPARGGSADGVPAPGGRSGSSRRTRRRGAAGAAARGVRGSRAADAPAPCVAARPGAATWTSGRT